MAEKGEALAAALIDEQKGAENLSLLVDIQLTTAHPFLSKALVFLSSLGALVNIAPWIFPLLSPHRPI